MRIISLIRSGCVNIACSILDGDWWRVRQKCLSLRAGVMKRLYVRRYAMIMHQSCASIPLEAEIPFRPCLPHGLYGVFMSKRAKIGRDVVIFQHVTIGSNTLLDKGGCAGNAPRIGDHVYIGASSTIIGDVSVGDNCRIGSNCCVYKSVPANTTVVGSSMRLIQKANLDNRFFSCEEGRSL